MQHVVACGEKNEARGFNRATQAKRQTGSAIKPIAILAPAIDKKIITAATVLSDSETTFSDGSEEGYTPKNYNEYYGDITVREALETSQNIPFVRIMEMLTPKTSIKYLKNMGVTTLTEKDENLALALGGLDTGMTPLETAAAYETIANDGKYIEPTFFTKIENPRGKVVIKSKQKTKQVFSKETAYIVKQLLTQPVKGTYGTATYCEIDGMMVCAKTGTTNDNYDRWLCGFTPYYTASTWYGFDINETIVYNGQNPAGLIWSSYMKKIHKDLNGKYFEEPTSIQEVTICKESGKRANKYCSDTYTEYFLKGTEPGECTIHSVKNKGKKKIRKINPSGSQESTINNEKKKDDKSENEKNDENVQENIIEEKTENVVTDDTNEENDIDIPKESIEEVEENSISDN